MPGLTCRFLLQVQYACNSLEVSAGLDPSLMVSILTFVKLLNLEN
jgi:hypothetical protein